MTLEELMAGVEGAQVVRGGTAEVRGLSYDSRRVQPGDLFLCVPGFRFDGHHFIPEAAARGAAACLVERPGLVPPELGEAVVPRVRLAAPAVARRFFGDPSRSLRLVGVTGTNGKTTTTHLVRWVLGRRGRVGLIGTVTNVVGGLPEPVERTTPEAVDLQRLLARMRAAGDTHCVLEVSSHALALHRVDGCAFDVAVFTNLTPDHLDFHGDLRRYLEAKARLFEMLGEGAEGPKGPKGAVLNGDDPAAAGIARRCRVPVLTYGLAHGDLTGRVLEADWRGTSFAVRHPGGETAVRLRLAGGFNMYNALAAFGVGLLEGIPAEEIAAALGEAQGVPGRFEPVAGDQPFAVVVDYAHTPDGLEKVLLAARSLARSRVIVAFGCGGDRDRAKRPAMGAIAARLADLVFITTDNPRSEDPAAIAREIEAGARRHPDTPCRVVLDREAAIREAVAAARPGDVVVIAGKGHERYQVFRDRTVPFDDREAAARALQELGYR